MASVRLVVCGCMMYPEIHDIFGGGMTRTINEIVDYALNTSGLRRL